MPQSPEDIRVVSPGEKKREVISKEGERLWVPGSWRLLPPGDAALTRRVKKAGPHWQVQEKRGRKKFSRGVWAPATTIEIETKKREMEKADPSYQKRLAASRARRKNAEEIYGEEFGKAILKWLDFPPKYTPLAKKLSRVIGDHALPVGSGTVARTRQIPLEDRTRAAVIAWMRHATTDYDTMTIPRIKGERRRVRRKLAQKSMEILNGYRRGDAFKDCPLSKALENPPFLDQSTSFQ